MQAGSTAPKAAAVIHEDFERGFIKADIAGWPDFDALQDTKGMDKVKAAGKHVFLSFVSSFPILLLHYLVYLSRRSQKLLNIQLLTSALFSSYRYRQEGKSYVMQDGDIVHFHFNVTTDKKK